MEKILDEYNCETYKLSGSIYNKLSSLQGWEQFYKIKVNEAKRHLDSFKCSPDNTNEHIVYSQELHVGHTDPTNYLALYQVFCDKIEEVTTDSFYYVRLDETRVSREDYDGIEEEFICYDLVFESLGGTTPTETKSHSPRLQSYDQDGYKSTQKYKQALQDYQECLEDYNCNVKELQDFLDTIVVKK